MSLPQGVSQSAKIFSIYKNGVPYDSMANWKRNYELAQAVKWQVERPHLDAVPLSRQVPDAWRNHIACH